MLRVQNPRPPEGLGLAFVMPALDIQLLELSTLRLLTSVSSSFAKR